MIRESSRVGSARWNSNAEVSQSWEWISSHAWSNYTLALLTALTRDNGILVRISFAQKGQMESMQKGLFQQRQKDSSITPNQTHFTWFQQDESAPHYCKGLLTQRPTRLQTQERWESLTRRKGPERIAPLVIGRPHCSSLLTRPML